MLSYPDGRLIIVGVDLVEEDVENCTADAIKKGYNSNEDKQLKRKRMRDDHYGCMTKEALSILPLMMF